MRKFYFVLLILLVSCENNQKYYFRSEASKLNDPLYMEMKKRFDSYSEEEKDVLEEIVMERFIMEKSEKN